MSENNQFIPNFDLFSESETDLNELYHRIDDLYNSVIVNFRLGKFQVYRPDICHHLDKQKFREWILNNNGRLNVNQE